jgi:hypothetical protein
LYAGNDIVNNCIFSLYLKLCLTKLNDIL